MHCPGCKMPLDEEGAFCGHCGEQLPTLTVRPHSPVHMRTPNEAPKMGYVKPVVQWQPSAMGDVQLRKPPSQSAVNLPLDLHGISRTPLPIASRPTPVPLSSSPMHNPIPTRPFRTVSGTGRNIVFLGIILMILLLGVLASALTLFQHKPIPSRYTMTSTLGDARGSVSFSDASGGQPGQMGNTNSLSISTSGLKPAPTGRHYAAWIIDEETEHISSLGTLTQKGSTFTVNFQHDNLNVLSMGNKLEITQESAQTTLPTGHVMLSAHFPALALVHIKHLLVSFPGTPATIGLLVGLRGQTQQLYSQTQLLKSGNDDARISCVAQNVVNLIEGSHGEQAQPLEPICASKNISAVDDGYGLLGSKNDGYVPASAMHASLAATQPDTTDTIRTHAQQVIDSTDNLTVWLKAIDQDARSLLNNPGDTNRVQDIIELSERALNGIDINHNGHVDPIKGEAGANTAYLAGQAMASLTLLPAS